MTQQDADGFAHFVAQLPDGERRFLKENLDDPEATFAGFASETSARRLVAVDESASIIGLAGAFPGEGWSSHVAELRVVVAAATRGRGVGRTLARAALLEAIQLGCTHAYVEVVAEQSALVTMFQDLGFDPEALLPDFVRDGAGEYHDLMLLTHRSDVQWSRNRLLDLEGVNA